MSHQATNWAIEQRAGGPSPKATLWSIANYANENWCSWPSQTTIARESEQSLDTVQRRVRDLEQEGLVRRIPLHFAGRKTVDFFILKPSPFFKAELPEIEPLLPRGYVVAPQYVTASCGSVDQAETQQKSGVSSPDAAANAAANAAALVRQPMNLGTKEVDVVGVARASGEPVLRPDCLEVAREVGKLCGYETAADWPPKWLQAPYTVERWLNGGWSRQNIIAACTEVMAGKRDGPPFSISYFENAIAQFIGRRNAPLPEVKVQQPETVHVVRKAANESRDDFRTALGKLKEFNRGTRASGGPGSRGTVELLPPARNGQS